MGFPQGKFESLGDLFLGVDMGDDGLVQFWNRLMRLRKCYDAVLEDLGIFGDPPDESVEMDLIRARIVDIDAQLDELKEKYRVMV